MNKDNFKYNNNNKHYFSNSSFCTSCYNPYAIKYTLQFLIDSNISIGSGILFCDSRYSPEIPFDSFSDIQIKGDLIYITDTDNFNNILPICNLLGILLRILPDTPLDTLFNNYAPNNTTCNTPYCCNNAMYNILKVGQTYPEISFNNLIFSLSVTLNYATVIYSNRDILWLEDGNLHLSYALRENGPGNDIYISPMYMVSYVSYNSTPTDS